MNNNIKVLNPGSLEAGEHGCTCPVIDNNYGRTPPFPPNNWWIYADCPLHGEGHSVDVELPS